MSYDVRSQVRAVHTLASTSSLLFLRYLNLLARAAFATCAALACLLQVFWPAPCIASANSPLPLINEGLVNWTRVLQVPPQKLIMGLPWYGYRYKCIDHPTPGEVSAAESF
jgi:hypothetical protein